MTGIRDQGSDKGKAATKAEAKPEPKPEPKEIARGMVMELRGDGGTHVLLRLPNNMGEEVYQITPGQQIGLKTAIAIFDDGSVDLVGKPPPEPIEIKLPTEPKPRE